MHIECDADPYCFRIPRSEKSALVGRRCHERYAAKGVAVAALRLVAYLSPVTNPIGRFFGAGGGAINWRMASRIPAMAWS